jgi:hypothetical protein
MKKLILVALILVGGLGRTALAQEAKVSDAWARLSKLQSILEYFYLETGFYPPTLEDLDQIINSRAPRGSKKLVLPLDPATGAPFHYKPNADGKHYLITVPDSNKYAGAKPTLSDVDWGFLVELANLRRYDQVVRQSSEMMQAVATRVELFAKDHSGHFPATFDEMMPKYLNRFPTDPLTGKNLTYKALVDGYIIANPNPAKYGMKTFQYSSAAGMQMEQITRPAAQSDVKVTPEIHGTVLKPKS